MNTRRRILSGAKSSGSGVTYHIDSVTLPLEFNGINQSGYSDYIESEHSFAMRIYYSLTFSDSNNATLTIDYTYSGRSGEALQNTPITIGLKKSYSYVSYYGTTTIAEGGPGVIVGTDNDSLCLRLLYPNLTNPFYGNSAIDIHLPFNQ
jgi:hypothetical protein